jgi:hypothetical protein
MSIKLARAAAIVGMAGAVSAPAALAQSVLQESSPLSGGVQMARKVLAQRQAQAAVLCTKAPDMGIDLSCSPKPCGLPNVRASGGTQPVNENAITVTPATNTDVISTANDYNCGTIQGIFASTDSGSTWARTCCTTPLPGNGGLGDPVPAYNSNGAAYVVRINTPDGGATGVIAIQRSATRASPGAPPAKQRPTRSAASPTSPGWKSTLRPAARSTTRCMCR